jgi:hypothetical protein
MRKLAITLLALGVLTCGAWNWMQQYKPVAVGSVVSQGWTDPISNYVFLADYGTNTSVTPQYGSAGSMLDNGNTSATPTHCVVSNQSAPLYVCVGTNELGDAIYGWSLDGDDDYFLINDNNNHTFAKVPYISNDVPFTICAWVNPYYIGVNMAVCSKWGSAGSREWGTSISSGQPKLQLNAQGNTAQSRTMTVSATIPQRDWTFVLWTGSLVNNLATNITAYTNGIVAPFTVSVLGTYIGSSNTTARVGVGGTFGQLETGSVAFVSIMNTNLTALEVTNLSYYVGCQKLQFPIAGGSTNHPSLNKRNRLPAGAYP